MGTVMGWCVQDKVNQEDSEQDYVDGTKKAAGSTGDAYLKVRLVICNDEDTDGRARVTTEKEPVSHVDWTEIRLCR